MGICCSCCCEDASTRDSGTRRASPYTPSVNTWGSYRRWGSTRGGGGGTEQDSDGENGMCVCRYCGARLHPVLFEGHQESCHANQQRAGGTAAGQRLSKFETGSVSDIDGRDDDELCVICLARLRCFAFLPCGHIVCCGRCAPKLDACPVCRQSRQGLCHVPVDVISRYQCRHCEQFIAPALFDGHREVCGFRMRQAQREREEQRKGAEAGGADGAQPTGGAAFDDDDNDDSDGGLSTPTAAAAAATDGAEEDASGAAATAAVETPTTTTPTAAAAGATPGRRNKHILTTCVECSAEGRSLVICLPCGHRVMCGECAQRRTTCPVCITEIRQTLNTYD